jgi:exodeoxyribonuclease VII small subunit
MTKTVKFEDAVKRLETIVSEMESGDLELEKSLALFEEGIKLVRQCTAKLDEAKKKVELLVKKGDKMVAEPFDSEEDAGTPDTNDTDLFRD